MIVAFAQTASVCARVATPTVIQRCAAGKSFIPRGEGYCIVARDDFLIDSLPIRSNGYHVRAADNIRQGDYLGERERTRRILITVHIIEAEIPIRKLQTRASARTPAFHRNAVEKIVVAKGMIVIPECGSVKWLILQKVHSRADPAEILPFISR